MAFLAGMAGFLLALLAFSVGVWTGKTIKIIGRQPRPMVSDDLSLSEQKRQKEFYNFLHYDGGRMTDSTEFHR